MVMVTVTGSRVRGMSAPVICRPAAVYTTPIDTGRVVTWPMSRVASTASCWAPMACPRKLTWPSCRPGTESPPRLAIWVTLAGSWTT